MTMAANITYEVLRQGKRRSLDIRQVRYSVTEWGDPSAPTFVYLHGWDAAGAILQFVVDALQSPVESGAIGTFLNKYL